MTFTRSFCRRHLDPMIRTFCERKGNALAISTAVALLIVAPHGASLAQPTAEPCDNPQSIGCDLDPDLGWIKRGTKRVTTAPASSGSTQRLSESDIAEMTRRTGERNRALSESINREILNTLPEKARCEVAKMSSREFAKLNTTPEGLAEQTKALAVACEAGRIRLGANDKYGPLDDTCGVAGFLYTVPPEFNPLSNQEKSYEMRYLECAFNQSCYVAQSCQAYTRDQDAIVRNAISREATRLAALKPHTIAGPERYKSGKSAKQNYKVNCEECHGPDGQGTKKGLAVGVRPLAFVVNKYESCDTFSHDVNPKTGRPGHGLMDRGMMSVTDCVDLALHINYEVLKRK